MILKLLPLIMIFYVDGSSDISRSFALLTSNTNNYVDTDTQTLGLSLLCEADGEYLFLEHEEEFRYPSPKIITFTYTGYYVELNTSDDIYFWYVSGKISYEYANSNYNYTSYVDLENGVEYQGTTDYENGETDVEYTFCIYVDTESAYDDGYLEGYGDGREYGYEEGYEDGKVDGLEQGRLEGQGINNVIEWFGSIWDGLARILALEIAPNLTIGTIITIPIVIAVLFFGLKALIQ